MRIGASSPLRAKHHLQAGSDFLGFKQIRIFLVFEQIRIFYWFLSRFRFVGSDGNDKMVAYDWDDFKKLPTCLKGKHEIKYV